MVCAEIIFFVIQLTGYLVYFIILNRNMCLSSTIIPYHIH